MSNDNDIAIRASMLDRVQFDDWDNVPMDVKIDLLTDEIGEFSELDNLVDMPDDEFDWFLKQCQDAMGARRDTLERLARVVTFIGPVLRGQKGHGDD